MNFVEEKNVGTVNGLISLMMSTPWGLFQELSDEGLQIGFDISGSFFYQSNRQRMQKVTQYYRGLTRRTWSSQTISCLFKRLEQHSGVNDQKTNDLHNHGRDF
jgi:hypothetical protein